MMTATLGKRGRSVACAAYSVAIFVTSPACALVSLSSTSAPLAMQADAGLVPKSWDRVQRLQPGSRLIVTLKSGARHEGTLNGVSQVSLVLIDPAGTPMTIERSDISRIVTPVDDKLVNGALTGAGIGLAAALAVLAAVGSGDGYVLPSAKWGAPALLSGVGILAGMLVDRAHKGQEVIYVTP